MSKRMRRALWYFLACLSLASMATVWWKWQLQSEENRKKAPRIDRSSANSATPTPDNTDAVKSPSSESDTDSNPER